MKKIIFALIAKMVIFWKIIHVNFQVTFLIVKLVILQLYVLNVFRCDISNCLICNDFNICIQCKNRYYLNLKGFCSECNIVHCKTCSINNDDKTCWECENDYKLENNECIQIKNSETKDDKSSNNKKLIIWLIITFIIILSLCIL